MPETGSYTPIDELDFFGRLEAVCDDVWDLVSDWEWFSRRTIGIQLVAALDSIGANLVEGDARYGEQDAIRFFRYARASLKESRYWWRRSVRRRPLSQARATKFQTELESISKAISKIISYRRDFVAVSQGREPSTREYGPSDSMLAFEPATHDRRPATESRRKASTEGRP